MVAARQARTGESAEVEGGPETLRCETKCRYFFVKGYAMGNDLKKFGVFIWNDWVALMSGFGSLVLAILGAVGGWPNGPPTWVFWATAFLCLVACAFRIWQKEYHEHEKAKEKIRTKLKIVGVA